MAELNDKYSVIEESYSCPTEHQNGTDGQCSSMVCNELCDDVDHESAEKTPAKTGEEFEQVELPVLPKNVRIYVTLSSGLKIPLELTPSEFRDLVIMNSGDWQIEVNPENKETMQNTKNTVSSIVRAYTKYTEMQIPLTLAGRLILMTMLKNNVITKERFEQLMGGQWEELRNYLPHVQTVFFNLFKNVVRCKSKVEIKQQIKTLRQQLHHGWGTMHTEVWRLTLRVFLFIIHLLAGRASSLSYSFSDSDTPYGMSARHFTEIKQFCEGLFVKLSSVKNLDRNLEKILCLLHGNIENDIHEY